MKCTFRTTRALAFSYPEVHECCLFLKVTHINFWRQQLSQKAHHLLNTPFQWTRVLVFIYLAYSLSMEYYFLVCHLRYSGNYIQLVNFPSKFPMDISIPLNLVEVKLSASLRLNKDKNLEGSNCVPKFKDLKK